MRMARDGGQSGQKFADVVGRVGGGERQAQPGLAAGDGRVADGGDEDAAFAQGSGGFDGLGFGADDERDDGAGNAGQRPAGLRQAGLHLVDERQ